MASEQNIRHVVDSAASAASSGDGAKASTFPLSTLSADDPSVAFRPNHSNANHAQHQPPPRSPHPHQLHPPHAAIYHSYPPPPSTGHFGGGPYSAAMGKSGIAAAIQYHERLPSSSRQKSTPSQGQPLLSVSPRHGYDREDQNFHCPIPARVHPSEVDYRSHQPPPHYGALPEDRRWIGLESAVGHSTRHPFHAYDGMCYSNPLSSQSFPPPPPPVAPGHMPYRYSHPVYPGNRMDNKTGIHGHQLSILGKPYNNDSSCRQGAMSPSQIEMCHRDEVTNMGCTCKKTKCLKLYCQCFAVKIYCGPNCRCLVCFNTTKHEQARQDAMRSILTRNPIAFDAKFSKSKEQKAKEQQLVLAHKLGCKCRKSACMKKYCECYAGNVKCSPNCRCISCKNTSSSIFGPGTLDPTLQVPGGRMADLPKGRGGRHGGEPWMMNAAHNLAFLKQGSPTFEKATANPSEVGEVASMPSLAASSSDTSPEEKAEDTSKGCSVNDGDATSRTVNSLLMAAMAMTEFQSRNVRQKPSQKNGSDDDRAEVPVQHDRPEASKVFRPSPKRKSSDRALKEAKIMAATGTQGAGDVSASDGNNNTRCAIHKGAGSPDPGDSRSPLDARDLKRTRLGSVRKKMTWDDEEVRNVAESSHASRAKTTLLETPNQKAASAASLTPVSARCIDLKKVHLSSSPPQSSLDEKNDA